MLLLMGYICTDRVLCRGWLPSTMDVLQTSIVHHRLPSINEVRRYIHTFIYLSCGDV